jgi:hypothetical protein
LFDGKTLTGWRGVGYDTVPTAHWVVIDGAIKKIASGNVPRVADGRPLVGGDLMTVDSFADFELSFEWKVTPGANSGVKYNVSKQCRSPRRRGHPEAPRTRNRLRRTRLSMMTATKTASCPPPLGALYDLVAPNAGKHLRPVGEWNQSKVIFRGGYGEPGSTDGKSSSSARHRAHGFLLAAKAEDDPGVCRNAGDTSSCRTLETKSISGAPVRSQ